MKTFYPTQEQNIYTCNNWTLSDETIEIFKSDLFYIEHVRWNVQRYRPSDLTSDRVEATNEAEASSTQIPYAHHYAVETTDLYNRQPISQQANAHADGENETIQTWSTSLRPKRKVAMNDNNSEKQMHAKIRKFKKN